MKSGHMTGKFARASAAALVALMMAGTPGAAVAQKAAQKDAKAPALKLSKPVQSLAAQAQKLQTEGNHAGAIELLKQADALPEKNVDDVYIVNMLTLNSAINLKDNALIEKSIEGALSTGKLAPEDQVKFRRNLGSMALQRQDYTKASAEFEKLVAMDPNDAQLLVEIAELQRRQKQNDKAIATMQQAIAVQEKAGTKADESWYRRTLAIAYDSKLTAQTVSTSEALLKAYPNPTNWRDVLIIYRDGSKLDDQGNLDVMRLMRANTALTGERDYAEYAETATSRGLPGEAKAVLDEGIAKGALKSTTPFVKELLGSANPKIAADKAALPGLERESKASANGKAALATADAHLGYGNFAKAAELYRVALAKGGVDANTANTRLGFALGKSGDKAGADAALKAVTGAPRDQLSRYYQIWLGNQA
jgi:tetratricopeptide (TPR) repeat protein